MISSKTHRSSSPGLARYCNKSSNRGIGSGGSLIVRNVLRYSQSQSMIFSGLPKHRMSVTSCSSISPVCQSTRECNNMRENCNAVFRQMYIRFQRMRANVYSSHECCHGILRKFSFVSPVCNGLRQLRAIFRRNCPCKLSCIEVSRGITRL